MKKDRHLDRDKLDFGNESIPKLFRQLFFPTLVGMVFNAVLTIIDGVFVGHGVGANGIAAVNIVAPLFMVVTGLGSQESLNRLSFFVYMLQHITLYCHIFN